MDTAFAQYLVAKHEITSENADRIRKWVKRNLEPIGMIAVEHGLIIGRQIDEILDRQRHTDAKFGELAVEMGFLTQDKVDTLLQVQEYRLLTNITEALALAGLIPYDIGFNLLTDFVKTCTDQAAQTCTAITA